MDILQTVVVLCSLSALAVCDPNEAKSVDKRSADVDQINLPSDEMDKRVFRYGKRALDEFGDALMSEEAKRVFRYGKRGDMDEEKRVFRFGKRGDDDLDEDKRVFRFGKRGDIDEEKRVFRFGKREDGSKRRVFRYGKRSDLDDDDFEAIKRKVFRFGKRYSDNRIPLDTRANEPHVPFRFGDDE